MNDVTKSSLLNELTGSICTRWAGQPVCVYESIDSTNAACTGLAKEGAVHGTVVVADMQTAGRGRRGRSWESPAGENLYFSLLLRPGCVAAGVRTSSGAQTGITPNQAPMLTLVMAVAVAKAIHKLTGHRADIKWPNDLVMDGRKVCGILTEMRMEQTRIDHVVIGVGVNVRDRQFSEELQDKATSLEAVCRCGERISRRALLETILQIFEELYEEFVTVGDLTLLQTTYNSLLVNLEREVTVLDPQGTYHGIAKGITKTGELVVELPDGSFRQVFAGEVSVRGIYGYV